MNKISDRQKIVNDCVKFHGYKWPLGTDRFGCVVFEGVQIPHIEFERACLNQNRLEGFSTTLDC